MTPKIVNPLGAAALVLLAAGGLAGCQVEQVHHHPPHGAVVGGVWYPHDYFYYPGVQVYFHIHSGTYWYRERGHWHRSHRLPSHIVLLPRHRVRIRSDHGEPWRDHHRHVERYPAYPPPRHERQHEHDRRERERNRDLHREHVQRRGQSGQPEQRHRQHPGEPQRRRGEPAQAPGRHPEEESRWRGQPVPESQRNPEEQSRWRGQPVPESHRNPEEQSRWRGQPVQEARRDAAEQQRPAPSIERGYRGQPRQPERRARREPREYRD